MTRDVAAMAQQIAQLKANVAELKTAQEQMAREMVKPPAPKPVADAKPIDPRARVSALPPRPPLRPVRKPKPITTAGVYADICAHTDRTSATAVAGCRRPARRQQPPHKPSPMMDGPVVRRRCRCTKRSSRKQHHRNRGARCTLFRVGVMR